MKLSTPMPTRRFMFAMMVLSGALFCYQAYAQSALDYRLLPSANPILIDVTEASQRARKQNIDIHISKQQVEIAHSYTSSSTANLLPNLTATGSHIATDNGPSSVLHDNASAMVKVTITLLDPNGIVDVKAKKEFAVSVAERSVADEDALIISVMS